MDDGRCGTSRITGQARQHHRRAHGRTAQGVHALPAGVERTADAGDRRGRRCIRHAARIALQAPRDRLRIERHPRSFGQPPGHDLSCAHEPHDGHRVRQSGVQRQLHAPARIRAAARRDRRRRLPVRRLFEPLPEDDPRAPRRVRGDARQGPSRQTADLHADPLAHRRQPRSGGREIPPRADRHRGRDDAAAGEAIRQRLLPRRRMVLRPGRRGNHRLRPRFRPGLRPHDLGAAAPYPEDPAQIRNPVVRAHCAGFRNPATESLRFQRGDFLRISRLQKIFALFDWCCLPLFGRQSSLNRGVCRGGFVPFGGKRYPKPSACRFRGNVVWHR